MGKEELQKKLEKEKKDAGTLALVGLVLGGAITFFLFKPLFVPLIGELGSWIIVIAFAFVGAGAMSKSKNEQIKQTELALASQ